VIKIDLHTHSIGSIDGGIKPQEYAKILSDGILDYIAITDHDTINEAVKLHAVHGNKIIVGQEITTNNGEIIGLFLSKTIKPGLSLEDAVQKIKDQNGLVYIPHPFETVRKGINKSAIDLIEKSVDIVEVHNGRALFQNKGPEAAMWSRLHDKATAASSDAHGVLGIGTTFTSLQDAPTAQNLVEQLRVSKKTVTRPPLISLLYPKYHRLRGKLK
jgi:predicted metal-dependent phosphoesterase TrpH